MTSKLYQLDVVMRTGTNPQDLDTKLVFERPGSSLIEYLTVLFRFESVES